MVKYILNFFSKYLFQSSCFSPNESWVTAMYSVSDLEFLHWSLWSPATKLLNRLDSKFNIILSVNQRFFFGMLPSWYFCYSFCYLLLIIFSQTLKLVFKFFDRLFNYETVLKVISSTERGTPHKFALVLGILDFRY